MRDAPGLEMIPVHRLGKDDKLTIDTYQSITRLYVSWYCGYHGF